MKQGIFKTVIIGMVGLSQIVAADSFTEEDINKSFYPYNDWTPTADDHTGGIAIRCWCPVVVGKEGLVDVFFGE